MHRLATIHNVTDRRQTDRHNTVPIARPLVRSAKNAPNSIFAGAPPQTPRGELTALPRPLQLDLRGRGSTSKGREGLFAADLTRGGGNTDICPGRQKPSRRHCDRQTDKWTDRWTDGRQHIRAIAYMLSRVKMHLYPVCYSQ